MSDTYCTSHCLCDECTNCIRSQFLEFIFQLVSESGDVAFHRLASLHATIGVALRYVVCVLCQDFLIQSPAADVVTDRERTEGVAMVGLLARNEVDTLRLWGRQLHEILNGHFERRFNSFGACVNDVSDDVQVKGKVVLEYLSSR